MNLRSQRPSQNKGKSSREIITTSFRFLGCAITALFLIIFSAQAQPDLPEPCTPDCPQSPWSPVQTMWMQAPPPFQSCSVMVNYVQRTACTQNYNDIQILNILVPFTTSCQSLIAHIAQNGSGLQSYMTKLHNILGVELIKAKFSQWYNDPATPSSQKDMALCGRKGDLGVQRWRVTRGSCYYNYLDPCNCRYVMRPCANTTCCLKQFYVCFDEATGKPKVNKTGDTFPTISCPPPPVGASPGSVVAADGNCFTLCDDDGLDEVLDGMSISTDGPDMSWGN